jgi:hypothetical protein
MTDTIHKAPERATTAALMATIYNLRFKEGFSADEVLMMVSTILESLDSKPEMLRIAEQCSIGLTVKEE